MGNKTRQSAGQISSTNPKTLKPYFFINGKLHKPLRRERALDNLIAFCYDDNKRYVLSWSETLKNYEPAFNLKQTAKLVNRTDTSIVLDHQSGKLPKPHDSYNINTGYRGITSPRFYSRTELYEIREIYAYTHRGQPRKDGRITNNTTPSKPELDQRLGIGGQIVYVKKDDEYVPIWKDN